MDDYLSNSNDGSSVTEQLMDGDYGSHYNDGGDLNDDNYNNGDNNDDGDDSNDDDDDDSTDDDDDDDSDDDFDDEFVELVYVACVLAVICIMKYINETRRNFEQTWQLSESGPSQKKRKLGGAKLDNHLSRLEDACELRSSANSREQQSSIRNVMELACTLPGVEKGSDLYFAASHIFLKKSYREMFVILKKPDLQLRWLKGLVNSRK
ncbi:hypothetical protein SO802_003293 [Lithocarpus litseifolius]|uniref:Uncharacterized protein n=1 Tax=Lithocarpus litseifolius TaxID=425828 RepID=A0AAW2E3G9_9ROSI